MLKSVLLCAILGYAHAAQYIVDVYRTSSYMMFKGTLRYPSSESWVLDYEECTPSSSFLVNKGDLGAGIGCGNFKTMMGFYFPSGYNGTITEAYDYDLKISYPCVVGEQVDYVTTYFCGDILALRKDPEDVETETVTTTAAPTTAATVTATATTQVTTTAATTQTTISTSTTKTTTTTTTTKTVSSSSVPSVSSCVKSSSVYGKKQGNGKSGQCCTSNNDCQENCQNGTCGTCDVDFDC